METLEFSPENQARLGLEPGERVRVLASGTKTLLLERLSATAGEALPWDRDLVLTADVRSFPIADILHLLHASAKSGFLFFECDGHAKSVYVHRGEVVFAASNQAFDRLGECLMRSGAITPDQYADAMRAYRPPGLFGKVLVERGLLTPRELWDGVKVQVEEIVRSLFSYGSGSTVFWEGEVRPDNTVRLSLPTRRLIAEGLKRRDDLLKFLAWLEAPQVQIEAIDGAGAKLTGTERAMYEAIRSGGSFQDQCRIAGVEPLCAARTIQHLRLLNAVVARSASPARGEVSPASAADPEALRECCLNHVKLLAEFAAPIVAVEGDEGLRERLGRVIAEAARRYPELLTGLELGRGALIDPDEMIRRALRYPGDREREVRLALGELGSYLEFELVTHPSIPDPDEFLTDLNELRERI